jgi:hypothetical protein
MIIRSIFALLLLTTLCTCGPASSSDAPETAGVAASQPYPSIDVTRLEYLFVNATYMDATFYDIPVSINQSELPQIKSTLGTISTESIEIVPGCKAVGHIWFQVNGKNIEEADIYFQAECAGYVWYEDGKPAYSNKMTQAGLNFYANIFQSVQGNTPE